MFLPMGTRNTDTHRNALAVSVRWSCHGRRVGSSRLASRLSRSIAVDIDIVQAQKLSVTLATLGIAGEMELSTKLRRSVAFRRAVFVLSGLAMAATHHRTLGADGELSCCRRAPFLWRRLATHATTIASGDSGALRRRAVAATAVAIEQCVASGVEGGDSRSLPDVIPPPP